MTSWIVPFVSADYADYRYSYDTYYTYGSSADKKDKSAKVTSYLKAFLLKDEEGLNPTIFGRLKKRKVIAIAGALAIVIGGISMISKALKSRSDRPLTVVTEQMPSQEIPLTQIKTDSTPPEGTVAVSSVEFSDEVKRLREQLGIDTVITLQKAAPEQPAYTKPTETASIPPQMKQESIAPEQNITPKQPEKSYPPQPYKSTKPGSVIKPVYTSNLYNRPGKIGLSQPYSLIFSRRPDLSSAKNEVLKLRSKGLSAFITIDFSMKDQKQYLICIGSHTSLSEAKQKANELLFLGFQGLFEPVKFTYSISLGTYSSKKEALNKSNKIQYLSDFAYVQPTSRNPAIPPKYLLLIGAFDSEETTDLFIHTTPDLASAQVLIR